MQDYDYTQEGLYFVTICAKDMSQMLFGTVVDGEMRLNKMGKIVQMCWEETPNVRKNVVLHEYVVMPNHFHAIFEICRGKLNLPEMNAATKTGECHSPLQNPHGTSKTVGAIVRGFKSMVTKRIGFSPWQRNYYEHIVRDFNDYARISAYIAQNPQNWGTDKYSIK